MNDSKTNVSTGRNKILRKTCLIEFAYDYCQAWIPVRLQKLTEKSRKKFKTHKRMKYEHHFSSGEGLVFFHENCFRPSGYISR